MRGSSSALLLVQRKFRQSSWIVKVALALSLPLSFYIYYCIASYLSFDHIRDKNFLEIHTCPACYGISLCDTLLKGHVQFTSISKYRILDYANTKNIFFGLLDNKTEVMLKKLGHNTELKDLEETICAMAGEAQNCDFRTAIYKTKLSTAREFTSYTVANISDMMRCPSQRLVSRMVEMYKERHSPRDFPLIERLHLYSTLLVNPEPLIIQVLPFIIYCYLWS